MKVIAGVHAGAEATLLDEDAVVGTDDDCDFVFEDAGLGARHFALRPVDTGVRLTLLDDDGSVRVDGRPVDDSVEVPAYSIVTCGRLALAFGPVGESWPTLAVPDSSAEAAPEAVEETPAEAPAEPAEPSPPSDELDVRGARPRRGAVVSLAAAAIALLAAGGWFLVPRTVERPASDPQAAAAVISRAAARHGAVVSVAVNDDGTVRVGGYIGTDQERTRLLKDLADVHHRAVVHITSTEELAAFARAVVEQSLGVDGRDAVTVAPVADSPGALHISGYVEDESSLAKARELLARDVKEARSITYDVDTRDTRIGVLRERLDGLGFATRLRIQLFPDRLGLFGPVESAEELSRVERLAAAFNEEFDARPRLEIKGTDSLLGESTIALDVRALVLGDDVHAVLHDGTSVGPGSPVVDGYAVETITGRYMVLVRPSGGLSGGTDVVYFIFEDA